MCLAIPMEITELKDGGMATVSASGATRDIALDLTPNAKVGDFVLVHAGFAIEVEAPSTLPKPCRSFRRWPTWWTIRCSTLLPPKKCALFRTPQRRPNRHRKQGSSHGHERGASAL